MKRPAIAILVMSLMTSLNGLPLSAQSSSSGSPASSGSSGTGNASRSNTTPTPNRQVQPPRFISGQVISESGQKIRDSVSARLVCGTRALQSVHTDLNGLFQFSLGLGLQSNMEITAADDSSPSAVSSSGFPAIGGPSTNSGDRVVNLSGSSLTGCEINISVSGYEPARRTITDSLSFGTLDVGVVIVKPIGTDEDDVISATSLLAPKNARKEFEKGVGDLRQNRKDSAVQHLEKAVSQYDEFAAAWYELGKLYSTSDSTRARHAFEKAIAADEHFVDPYVHLAALKLDARDNPGAIQTAAKALAIQPLNRLANYIHAVGNFNLDRLDEAEKSARTAEKTKNGYLPQLHALLADILVKKGDYPNAILEMQSYLQEAPLGAFATQIKQNLERLNIAGVHTGSDSSSVVDHP